MYNRTEIIPIDLELNKQESMKRHALALKILLPHGVPKTADGDTLKVHWTLTCAYLEETALTLEAIGSICDDPDVIVNATCAPLEEGKILVLEVLKKLEAVIAKVRARQEAESVAAQVNREANAYWKKYWENTPF
jgi:hypothetical protein